MIKKTKIIRRIALRKDRSAIKRAIQSEKRRLRNLHIKSTMKTTIKKVISGIERGDKEEIARLFREAVSYIDRSASKGVIHKNQASRKVSRLSKKVHGILHTEA